MIEQGKTLYSVPDLATKWGQPESRIRHALQTYKIGPAVRVGITRLFSEEQLFEIHAAVKRVEGRAK